MHTKNQLPVLSGSTLNVTRSAAQQQHRVSWGGGVGGPGHYVVTPTRVELS